MDENLQVIKGKVIAHSFNKEEIYQALESATEQPLASIKILHSVHLLQICKYIHDQTYR